MKPILTRHEWITLALGILFGLAGAWLYKSYGDLGEWLATWLAIPPVVYYLAFAPKDKTTS